jgi:hypothetical protein
MRHSKDGDHPARQRAHGKPDQGPLRIIVRKASQYALVGEEKARTPAEKDATNEANYDCKNKIRPLIWFHGALG